MEQRFPTADQLEAAGVPGWVLRVGTESESDGIYYVWSTGASVAGRLFVKPRADRTSAISRLVEYVETTREGAETRAWDNPFDLNQPVAMVVFQSGPLDRGMAVGSLSRPQSELLPLRDMLAFAFEDLRRSGGEDA